MNSSGKKMRKQTGLSRYQIHRSSHAVKTDVKRKKMGWGKSGKLEKN